MNEDINKSEAAAPEFSGAAQTAENKSQTTTLLGSISYNNEADYETFLNGLTLEHAFIILIASANYAQAKGAFSLAEAELINKAIKRLKPTKVEPTPAKLEQTEQPPLDEKQS